jgi:HAD superfamily hydrolase (TIGR01450 family)
MDPEPTTMRALLDRHGGALIDAYGVLVDARGALPGAAELIAELTARALPFAIVTNDASRSQDTYRARFAGYGIAIAADRFVTSGSLLAGYFARGKLAGARCAVLGTDDSRDYVRRAGGEIVPLAKGMAVEVVVVCDDDGFPFLEGIELVISAAVRAIDHGRPLALVLPNPDLVYPKGDGELGVTAGAIALVVEAALAQRFPQQPPRFERLGKPAPHLFAAGAALLDVPVTRLVMIGDQLDTDVAGANAAGMAVALVEGVSRWRHARRGPGAPVPTYLLDGIAP